MLDAHRVRAQRKRKLRLGGNEAGSGSRGFSFPLHDVTLHDFPGEPTEFARVQRRAGAVWRFAARGRREAKSDRGVKLGQSVHLFVEPGDGVGTIPVSPTDAGAKLFDTEPAQPIDGEFEAMILKVKPLANPEFRVEMF